jgi:4-alpha-methyl-delta7-sterol-4alpha-methyl oxidase
VDTALKALVDFLQQLWADPLYRWAVLGTTAVSMGAFALFAGVLTLMAWREPAWARPWRIQSRRPRAQSLVGPSLVRWMVNNLAFTALVSAAWRWLPGPGVHLGLAPSVWELAAQFVFFVYVDDFLYYWMHRAMHTRWLFKRVHGVHHRILTPWAITGHYMHPVEFVLTGALALAVPWLIGAHVYTLWAWITFRQWEAAEGHCGYDMPWSPSKLLPGSDGARHHDVHHARVRGAAARW